MINSIIKKELDKCKNILPEYDENTTYIFIPRQSTEIKKEIVLQRDFYYIIKLAKYILYPPENFTLDSNWNHGIHPKSEYMIVTPIKFVGKMIQFDGCGYDYYNDKNLDDVYNGLWLPQGGIEVIEEIRDK